MKRHLSFLIVTIALIALVFTIAACSIPAAPGASVAEASGAASTRQGGLLAGNGDSLPATISVNGVGTASAAPDVAYIQLGIETVNTDPAVAVTENTDKMEAIMAALASQGVAAGDIQTVNYTMWSEQVVDRDGQPTGETRYHVSNQVRVKVTDLSKTGSVLAASLEAGANTVNGIEFSVSDPTSLQAEARDKAIANAKAKADQLAAGFGIKVGAVHNINEFSVVIAPTPRMEAAAMGGGGPVPVSPSQFEVTVEIQTTFDIAQ